MHSSPVIHHPLLVKLCDLLANPDLPARLSSILSSADVINNEHVCLRIDATVCFPDRAETPQDLLEGSLLLVCEPLNCEHYNHNSSILISRETLGLHRP